MGEPRKDSQMELVGDQERKKPRLSRFSEHSLTLESPLADEEQKKDEKAKEMVSFFRLFRCAESRDKWLIALGFFCAVVHGCASPAFCIIFGAIVDSFSSSNQDQLVKDIEKISSQLAVLAAIVFVASTLQVWSFVWSAQRQSIKIRKEFFKAVIRQEIGWFDENPSGGLATRMAGDTPKIQDALGDKLGAYVQFMTMALAGFGVGFYFSWKMTLVILSVSPLLAISGAVFAKTLAAATSRGQTNYALAGAIADEVLTLIRVVTAFGTHARELTRFNIELLSAKKAGIKVGFSQGFGMGITMLLIFSTYALGFWYGGKLVRDGEMSAGDVVTVFFAVVMGAMGLGQAAPSMAAIAGGRGAAVEIFKILDRTSQIDSISEEGERPADVKGHIRLENVQFAYPTRKHEPVLNSLSIEILPNQKVALVGQSGCGKSTVMQLLERFYDVDGGAVTLDGKNVKALNIQWLRQAVGIVSQNPTLFPTTIFENIGMGKEGATREEIEQAAKLANAHKFIMSFPQGYETNIGDQGAQLSGGQRQRIAIARALVKNPRILLLDEATSALDNESEAIVQKALEEAGKNRTTITIAHRLSTIQHSDLIYVLGHGVVVEKGTHEELMGLQGTYFAMVQSQRRGSHDKVLDDDISVATEDKEPDSPKKAGPPSLVKQLSKEEIEEKRKAEEKDLLEEAKKGKSLLLWALRFNSPEWPAIITGTFFAICEGLIWPAYALILAQLMKIMLDGSNSSDIRTWSIAIFLLGVIFLISSTIKFTCFAYSGENLTFRMRSKSFWVMMNQDIEWYDHPDNSKSILCQRLETDAAGVRNLAGERLGVAVQLAATLFGGIGLGFYFCWRVALVVLACIPVVALGGVVYTKMMVGHENGKEFEESGRYASQAIENIRTVAALGRVKDFLESYSRSMYQPAKLAKRKAVVQGLTSGFGEFCMFAIWALSFWYGSKNVDHGYCSFADMMKAISGIIFGAMMGGQLMGLSPDISKATACAVRIRKLLEWEQSGKGLESVTTDKFPELKGAVSIEDVSFHYPMRPEVPVLNHFNLTVEPGRTMALVGPSGCGKSTILQLLESFYRPNSGRVLVDKRDINEMDLEKFRKHVAYVPQDADLFSMSIADNIAYGLDENEVTPEQVEEAAKEANAHDFIMEFSDGYNTSVGHKGTKLSGGQRQRIAIARALIRKDKIKILLLDEATSALDSANEELVHQALDRAREGRTTIIVAHRLSTIQNADMISVVQQGEIVEQGTHDELIAKQGPYFHLVKSQNLMGANLGEC